MLGRTRRGTGHQRLLLSTEIRCDVSHGPTGRAANFVTHSIGSACCTAGQNHATNLMDTSDPQEKLSKPVPDKYHSGDEQYTARVKHRRALAVGREECGVVEQKVHAFPAQLDCPWRSGIATNRVGENSPRSGRTVDRSLVLRAHMDALVFFCSAYTDIS